MVWNPNSRKGGEEIGPSVQEKNPERVGFVESHPFATCAKGWGTRPFQSKRTACHWPSPCSSRYVPLIVLPWTTPSTRGPSTLPRKVSAV